MNKADKPEDSTPGPMRHALCLVSHELPGAEPGRFRRFEAGTVYEVAVPDEIYFRAVYGGTEADAQSAEGMAQRGSKRKSA